jgi:rRNA maturation RNase YbeY
MISFVSVDGSPLPKERKKLRKWLKGIAEGYGVKFLDISFAFGNPDWMADLNWRHLGHHGDTDILTFDYELSKPVAVATNVMLPSPKQIRIIIRGECCICPLRVKTQSADWGSSEQEEMRRVLVHGLLHLIGFDDKKTTDQKLMREAEDHALAIFASLE